MATLIFNGATEQVTGSCFLLHTKAGRVLFDCGMFQGDGDDSEERNEQPFPFDAKAIDAVVLTHAPAGAARLHRPGVRHPRHP